MLGKKRYEVATVEKKIETNESSLKLRESIPIIRALARKKTITGTRGSMMRSGASRYSVSPVQIAIIPIK